MTYRIETLRRAGQTVITFFGLLDDSALSDLAARVAETGAAQLVLATGTEVTQSAMVQLRGLRVAMRAESPFLAAWLRNTHSGEPT